MSQKSNRLADEDIPLDSEDTQILTAKEPNFSRVFARGTLLQFSDDDPETIQIGFWTEREEDIEIEDEEETATGYRLESEAVMTWSSANRLKKLLEFYISEHGPEELSTDSGED